MPLTKIDAQEIRAVLSEYRMNNASVSIHQPDATIEDLIDVVEGNRSVMDIATSITADRRYGGV